MRMILLAGMMSMAAVTARAESSIDVITTDDNAQSIDYVTCTGCAPLKTKHVKAAIAPLKAGTQRIELKTVNGVLKVFRTEAWLGGSPVTYVSKASTDLIDKHSAEVVPTEEQKAAPMTIDKDATTSAVIADMSGASATVDLPKPRRPFDPQKMQLRLN